MNSSQLIAASAPDSWRLVEAAAAASGMSPRICRMAEDIAKLSPIFSQAPWREATGRYTHETYARATSSQVTKISFAMGLTKVPFFVRQLFYADGRAGNSNACGFSVLYNTTDRNKAQNAVNVIDCGAKGGSSIWFVRWHPQSIYMVYPNGSDAGLSDAGITSGLIVADWRCAARIANIGHDCAPEARMAEAMLKTPVLRDGDNAAFYMGRAAHALIGKLETYRGFPVHVIPELHGREARVV